MLKASDGQFDSLKVLRVIATVGDATLLIGRTITGQTSGATAIVENVLTLWEWWLQILFVIQSNE